MESQLRKYSNSCCSQKLGNNFNELLFINIHTYRTEYLHFTNKQYMRYILRNPVCDIVSVMRRVWRKTHDNCATLDTIFKNNPAMLDTTHDKCATLDMTYDN